MIKLNTNLVKNPSLFTVDIEDIVGVSDRNALGSQLVDRIAQKRAINIEWRNLTQSEIEAILDEIMDVFVTMEYPDPYDDVVSREFRVLSRSMPKAMYRKGGVAIWERLGVELIER